MTRFFLTSWLLCCSATALRLGSGNNLVATTDSRQLADDRKLLGTFSGGVLDYGTIVAEGINGGYFESNLGDDWYNDGSGGAQVFSGTLIMHMTGKPSQFLLHLTSFNKEIKILNDGTMRFKGIYAYDQVENGAPLWEFESTIIARKGPQTVEVTYKIRHIYGPHADQGDWVQGSLKVDLFSKDAAGNFDKRDLEYEPTEEDRCTEYPSGQPKDCSQEIQLRISKDNGQEILDWSAQFVVGHKEEGKFIYGGGEPHFHTWGGEWFDYMGGCDLVLLQNSAFGYGLGLDIHGRTKVRYQYSYLESVAMRIGEDTLEVSSYGDYSINGVDSPVMEGQMVGHIAGFPIFHTQMNKKRNIFDVVLNPNQNITLTTTKDFVAVKIQDEGSYSFGGSVGLMGDYDSGLMLGRDGATKITDPNSFGQEWQVLDTEFMLFRAVLGPQYPQKCLLPDSAMLEIRRLGENGVTKEEAEIACSDLASIAKDNCIYDVMATGDLDMAMAGAD